MPTYKDKNGRTVETVLPQYDPKYKSPVAITVRFATGEVEVHDRYTILDVSDFTWNGAITRGNRSLGWEDAFFGERSEKKSGFARLPSTEFRDPWQRVAHAVACSPWNKAKEILTQ